RRFSLISLSGWIPMVKHLGITKVSTPARTVWALKRSITDNQFLGRPQWPPSFSSKRLFLRRGDCSITPSDSQLPTLITRWALPAEYKQLLESIARDAVTDIKDFKMSETASSCSYTPYDGGGVINAAAYRAFLLTSASRVLASDDYWKTAERNLNFVLENQNP